MTEPSIAELVRRLDESTKHQNQRLDEVARSVERLINTLEQSYVRRDVYVERMSAIEQRMTAQSEAHRREAQELAADLGEVRTVLKEGQNRWKQLAFTVGATVVAAVFVALIVAAGVMPGGGAR